MPMPDKRLVYETGEKPKLGDLIFKDGHRDLDVQIVTLVDEDGKVKTDGDHQSTSIWPYFYYLMRRKIDD